MEERKYFWTMKNGEKINIDDMTESHLRNVLKLIIRRTEDVPKNCPYNIEDAIDLAEQENSEPFCDDWMWK
jgi:hypothetical protein